MRTQYARKRYNDPQTSLFAADSVTNISSIQKRILHILEAGEPMTDEEIATRYRTLWGNDATDQSLRSRRSELRDQGLVRFSGELGRTKFNRATRKWTIA